MRRWRALALLAGLVARAAVAAAAPPGAAPPSAAGDDAGPPTAALDYRRGAGAERCPDEPTLRAQVARRLGYDPFRERAPRRLRVVVRAAGRDLLATVDLFAAGPPRPGGDRRGGDEARGGAPTPTRGRRTLSAPGEDCVDLAGALALALAIAIDPLVIARPPPPPASPEATAQPGARSTSPPRADAPAAHGAPRGLGDRDDHPPRPAALPPARPGATTHLGLGLAAFAAVATAPTAAFGFRLQAAVLRRPISIGLEGRLDLPASQPLLQGRYTVTAASAWLVPCVATWHFRACALAGVGATRTTSSGYDLNTRTTALLVGVGGRAAIELPLHPRVRLQVQLDVIASLAPRTYSAGVRSSDLTRFDTLELFRTPPVSSSLAIALVAVLGGPTPAW